MGPTHRLLGACAGIAWAGADHLGPGQAALGIGVAVITSSGRTSPDLDQAVAVGGGRTTCSPTSCSAAAARCSTAA